MNKQFSRPVFLVFLLAALCRDAATAQGVKTPIANGVLQTHLNGGNFALTNVASVKFADGTSMTTASGGGTPMTATNAALATNVVSGIQITNPVITGAVASGAFTGILTGTSTVSVTSTNARLATNVVSGIQITNPVITGAVASGTFTGDGSGLNSLNASQLTSGTVDPARLPPVILTNSYQNDATFNGGLSIHRGLSAHPTNSPSQVALDVWNFPAGATANLAQFWNTNQAKLSGVNSNAMLFGDGGGLTNLNPANLNAGTAAINISGTAATATLAATATTAVTATNLALSLRLIATGGRGMTATTPSNRGFQSRTIHTARDNITKLSVIYANWFSFQELVAGTGSNAVITASVEYPSNNFTQITFSGIANGTIPAGGQLMSDMVTLTTPIPNGAIFYMRQYYTNASGIVYVGETIPGVACEFGNTEVDKTMGGTIGPGGGFGYYPLAVIGYTSKPAVSIVGDSRGYGLNEGAQDSQSSIGDARMVEGKYACANLCMPSDTAVNFWSHTNRQAILKYCSTAMIQEGINELTTVSNDVSLLASNIMATYNVPSIATTLEPWTTSSDSWLTTIGQTVTANESYRVAYNEGLRKGNIPNLSGFIDEAAVVESGTNSGLWIPGSVTLDGLHGILVAYQMIRDSIGDVLNASVMRLPIQGGTVTGTLNVMGQINILKGGTLQPLIASTTNPIAMAVGTLTATNSINIPTNVFPIVTAGANCAQAFILTNYSRSQLDFVVRYIYGGSIVAGNTNWVITGLTGFVNPVRPMIFPCTGTDILGGSVGGTGLATVAYPENTWTTTGFLSRQGAGTSGAATTNDVRVLIIGAN